MITSQKLQQPHVDFKNEINKPVLSTNQEIHTVYCLEMCMLLMFFKY